MRLAAKIASPPSRHLEAVAIVLARSAAVTPGRIIGFNSESQSSWALSLNWSAEQNGRRRSIYLIGEWGILANRALAPLALRRCSGKIHRSAASGARAILMEGEVG